MIDTLIGAGTTDAAGNEGRLQTPLACIRSLASTSPSLEFRPLGVPNGCTPMAFFRLSAASDAIDSGLNGLDALSTWGGAIPALTLAALPGRPHKMTGLGVSMAAIDELGRYAWCSPEGWHKVNGKAAHPGRDIHRRFR